MPLRIFSDVNEGFKNDGNYVSDLKARWPPKDLVVLQITWSEACKALFFIISAFRNVMDYSVSLACHILLHYLEAENFSLGESLLYDAMINNFV